MAMLGAACTLERGRPSDSAASDGAVAEGIDQQAAPPDPAPLAADSLVALEPEPPVAQAVADTTPLVATDAELRELAAVITMPVQGVRAEDLRDTYDEARGARVHRAIDILAPRNTPVLSAIDGRVLRLHESRAGGLMVYAGDASNRFVLMYGHLERYADGLAEGQLLRRGQTIGYVGTSGNAPPGTPHLHFVVARGRPEQSWWRGTPVNPYPLLTGRATP